MAFRIATFNVENLFARAAILNLKDQAQGNALMKKATRLQELLGKDTYTAAIRTEVYDLSADLRPYVDLREDAGTLGQWKKDPAGTRTGFQLAASCKGRDSWLGEMVFKRAKFDDVQRMNSGQVITSVNADVLCAIEVEGMTVLDQFNEQVLDKKRYDQFMSIDSPNDPRGIDVAFLSRHPITGIRTHMFDSAPGFRRVFSRDCLELAVDIGQGRTLFVLCNHFKSQRAMSQAEADKSAAKRKAQATRVTEILGTYDLTKDLVVVLGDLNEDSASPYASLKPLFDHPGLSPVVDPSLPIQDRWTYYYGGAKKGERFSQLDHIFLSDALAKKVKGFGFERRGIGEIDKATAKEGFPSVTPFPEVTSWRTAASDHGALWVDLDL